MDPTPTHAPEAAKPRPAARGAGPPQNGIKGEDRSFEPRTTVQGETAPPPSADAVSAEAIPSISEVDTALRDAVLTFAALQCAAGQWADSLLWRGVSWWTLPSLVPAHPLKGFGLPLLGLPAADVRESDAGYVVSVELPGLNLDNISLRFRGDVVTISGEKRETTQEARAACHVSERRFGQFERSFPIPPDVARDRISAHFQDGVLQVELPKAKSAG